MCLCAKGHLMYSATHVCGSCLKTGQHSIFVIMYKENYKLIHVCWIPQIDDFMTIMEQYILNIRIIIIIIGNKKNKQYLGYGIRNYTFYGQ